MAYDDDDALERKANRVCKVYDNDDVFTVFVQLFLALAALLSLWIKREYEHPKRRFVTWFLDVSKQGVGACYAHVMNMVRFLCFLATLAAPDAATVST